VLVVGGSRRYILVEMGVEGKRVVVGVDIVVGAGGYIGLLL
jgi:hypothetical protein